MDKIDSLGLQSHFSKNLELPIYLRKVWLLVFVPAEDITEIFKKIVR